MKARSALRAVALDDPEPSRVLEAVNGYLRRELASDSDGVLEAGGSDDQFGADRLRALLHTTPCSGSAEAAVDAILSALDEHAGLQLDDDVAVVALQRMG